MLYFKLNSIETSTAPPHPTVAKAKCGALTSTVVRVETAVRHLSALAGVALAGVTLPGVVSAEAS